MGKRKTIYKPGDHVEMHWKDLLLEGDVISATGRGSTVRVAWEDGEISDITPQSSNVRRIPRF